MRVSLQRSELSQLLASLAKVVDTRNTIPLLSHVLLVVDGDTLDLRATDLDIEASAWITLDEPADQPTTVAVPGRDFADIVKRLAADTVQLELDGQWLYVKGGRSRFKLPTLLGDSFPSLEPPEDGVEFTANLAALTKQVAFAVGGQQHGFQLSGVYLSTVNGTLTASATDAKRVVQATAGAAPQFSGVLLPPKLLANLPTGEVDVLVGSTRIAVRQGPLVLVSKLIEGQFPDLSRLWPRDQSYALRADRAALRAAVERVAALSDEDRGKGVTMSVVPGSCVLSVDSATRGTAEEEVPIEYNGEPYDVGFNVSFLAEMLGAVPGGEVEVALGGTRGANFNGAPGWSGCLMYFDVKRGG